MKLLLLFNSYESNSHYHDPLCMFAQISERLQAQEVEECSSCDIEILNSKLPLNETTTEPLNAPPSPGSQSRLPLHTDYCPQSVLCHRPDPQQWTNVTNETYFHTVEEDLTEKQEIRFSGISEASESLQESCSVVFGYISNETL